METVLACDARGTEIYVRADHRKHGPRRALLRSDLSPEERHTV
jgi:hypothetical protein